MWRLLFAGVLLLSGCDTLFPEFGGKPVDAAVPRDGGITDGGTEPMIAGAVCILADVRDYRTCATGSPGILRITVEETRQQTMTDATGRFTLPLSAKIDVANVAVPLVSADTLQQIELANGLVDDPQRGTLLGWAVDPTGAPVTGVSSGNTSAFYDDNAPNTLSAGIATHAKGTIALFTVTPPMLTLTLTAPPTAAVSGDTFTVPIRSGAITATTLVLPPR
jgi:hypothetical protein